MSDQALTQQPQGLAYQHEMSVEDLLAQVTKIQTVIQKVMKKDEHYGVVPGTSSKPSLFKAGAEKLCLLFRLAPHYNSVETYDGAHLTVKSICTLVHIPTGQVWGTGEGSCSSKESKYAYRKGQRACPACKGEFIIKGKQEYGGGWLCFGKKGGCGAKFPDGDVTIEGQSTDRVANEDLADQYNTILKMSDKRSLVASVLNATAASDFFTQDLEDLKANAAARGDVIDTTATRVDPETGEVRDQPPATEPRGNGDNGTGGKITPKQFKFFWLVAGQHGWADVEAKALVEKAGYEHVEDIKKQDFNGVLTELKKKVKG